MTYNAYFDNGVNHKVEVDHVKSLNIR